MKLKYCQCGFVQHMYVVQYSICLVTKTRDAYNCSVIMAQLQKRDSNFCISNQCLILKKLDTHQTVQ